MTDVLLSSNEVFVRANSTAAVAVCIFIKKTMVVDSMSMRWVCQRPAANFKTPFTVHILSIVLTSSF